MKQLINLKDLLAATHFFSTVVANNEYFTWHEIEGADNARLLQVKELFRRVPAQDGLFALILWYVAKTLY